MTAAAWQATGDRRAGVGMAWHGWAGGRGRQAGRDRAAAAAAAASPRTHLSPLFLTSRDSLSPSLLALLTFLLPLLHHLSFLLYHTSPDFTHLLFLSTHLTSLLCLSSISACCCVRQHVSSSVLYGSGWGVPSGLWHSLSLYALSGLEKKNKDIFGVNRRTPVNV